MALGRGCKHGVGESHFSGFAMDFGRHQSNTGFRGVGRDGSFTPRGTAASAPHLNVKRVPMSSMDSSSALDLGKESR